MRRLSAMVAGGIASLLLLSVPAGSNVAELDVFRSTHVYQGKVVTLVMCEGDVCSADLPPPVDVIIPASLGEADVTATLTLEYRTSAGDHPLVDMDMQSPGEEEGNMSPGPLRLRGGSRTTTTLTWVRFDVEPAAEPHTFRWAFEAAAVSPPFTLRALEAVLVIEATPS